MNLFSVLDASHVIRKPYPHILKTGLLDDELCRQLAREYPPLETFTKGRPYPPSCKLYRRAKNLLNDPKLSPAWRRMIEDNIRPEVLSHVFRLFKDDVLKIYPDFETRVGPIDNLRVGVRHMNRPEDCDVLLDAQMVSFMPAIGRASVERGPHVKNPDKFGGLHLFLPDEDDDTPGGEIEVYELRPGFKPLFDKGNQVAHEYLRLVHSAPYQRNSMFVYINSPWSLQQVAMRAPSRYPLRFLNIPFTVPRPDQMFDLPRVAKSSKKPVSWMPSLFSQWWHGRQRRRADPAYLASLADAPNPPVDRYVHPH